MTRAVAVALLLCAGCSAILGLPEGKLGPDAAVVISFDAPVATPDAMPPDAMPPPPDAMPPDAMPPDAMPAPPDAPPPDA